MNGLAAASGETPPAPSRRPLGGLGRGLAGILDDTATDKPESLIATAPTSPERRSGGGSGLQQLLGRQHSSTAASVRAFVVETALAAIADAFGADGVVMTTRERSALPPTGHYRYRDAVGAEVGPDLAARRVDTSPSVALRLPPSWGPSSPALFALYGILWEMLTDERHHCANCGTVDRPLAYRQARVDSSSAWFCRIDDQSVSVAAALVRSHPFDEAESEALARSMASVVTAVSTSDEFESQRLRTRVSADVSLSADVGGEDPANAITAEVTVRNGSQNARPLFVPYSGGGDGAGDGTGRAQSDASLASLTATGRGPDIETAVARAAANACRPQCRIQFAGSSDLDGQTIAVVIVNAQDGSPRLGVSVRPMGDYSAVAEAVFLAASTGGIPRTG